MSGGGKGGKKTTEKALPDWLRGPAERNLQRAEAVQQIEYMPYYGPEVAAFTPAQNAAFDANIGAAEAFGLLAPNTLTATSGMPTPTEYAGGFTGYSSQGLYDQALNELKAKQPGAVAQYNALFGNATPTLLNRGGGSRFRGNAPGSPPSGNGITTEYNPYGRPERLVPAYGNMERFKNSQYNANLPGGGLPIRTYTPPVKEVIPQTRTKSLQQGRSRGYG